MNQNENCLPEDMAVETPSWADGKTINESVFCEEFLRKHKILFSGGSFFTTEGRVVDEAPLRRMIFDDLKIFAVSNVPQKISNIVELLKLEALDEDFVPQTDRVHLEDGTLYFNGCFVDIKSEIVRTRLPVRYNPYAPRPERWLSFLDELLYPEDIPTLQEFIGYCLIPSNKGQRMMIIKGNGGEGKSQIGAVMFYDEEEYKLPEPSHLMTAKAYKSKIVEPLFNRLLALAKTAVKMCFEFKTQVESLKLWAARDKNTVTHLRKENDELYTENQKLHKEVKEFKLLKRIFGEEKISELVKSAKETERAQKRTNKFKTKERNR